MRLFVTGGNGFIGSAVVRALSARGQSIRCLLRNRSRIDRIRDLPVERVTGDVRDPASVVAGMQGCDAVLHLAGLSRWADIHSPLMEEVTVRGTINVLDSAEALGRLPVVFVSSTLAVNGSREPAIHDEESSCTLDLDRYVYARAKREAEARCRQAAARALPVVIVNPGEVYGPDDTTLVTAGNLIDFARSSTVLVSRGGTSVVHVDDVSAGIIAALEKGRPGERYILGGENLTIRQLAELTLRILGLRKRIRTAPNWLLRGLAGVASSLPVSLPFEPAIVPYATRYWFMDSGKARRELGVTFRSAEETLAPTLHWLREAGHV